MLLSMLRNGYHSCIADGNLKWFSHSGKHFEKQLKKKKSLNINYHAAQQLPSWASATLENTLTVKKKKSLNINYYATQQLPSWTFIPENGDLCSQKSCVLMFTAALFIVAKNQIHPEGPLGVKWLNTLW